MSLRELYIVLKTRKGKVKFVQYQRDSREGKERNLNMKLPVTAIGKTGFLCNMETSCNFVGGFLWRKYG